MQPNLFFGSRTVDVRQVVGDKIWIILVPLRETKARYEEYKYTRLVARSLFQCMIPATIYTVIVGRRVRQNGEIGN